MTSTPSDKEQALPSTDEELIELLIPHFLASRQTACAHIYPRDWAKGLIAELREADVIGCAELEGANVLNRAAIRNLQTELTAARAEVERLKKELDIAVADRFDAVIGAREVDGQLLDAATEAATLRKHLESVIDFVHANVGAMEAQEMRDAYLKAPEPEPPGPVNHGMDSDE